MAKTPKGQEAPHIGPDPGDGRTPFERMRDLTRRVVQVPKSELRTKPTAGRAKRKKTR